jgi:filamentous hemagglutinin family protein
VTYRPSNLFLSALQTSTALSLLAITPAYALPSGGQVVGGQASIATAGTQTTITQSTDRGIINWQSFDIGTGEHVLFQQPSASSVTLNRVTGGQGASQILGNLTANGTVMLVNPNGVFFGAGSQVNVGNMVVTSSDIEDDRFMAGDYRFDKPGNAGAMIINNGLITAADAGLVSFVAPNVVNNGLIQAKLGTVQLASGDSFTIDLYGDGLINLEASDALTSQIVSNSGVISASGGRIVMTAAAANEVVNSLINMDGIVEASSIGERNGEIVIFAEGANAVKGNDASKKNHKQGSSNVIVSGIMDASGRNPGERGGHITVTGDNVALLDGTLIDASGHTGLSGTTDGKLVSAHREGSAGGDIRIGGDYLGQGDTPTAKNLYVDAGALIVNDALHTGDAGRTIFWSDGTTAFYGNVYARALGGQSVNQLTWNATAGGNQGDGGFVETSGHEHLDAGGYVDLTASSGKRGTYFLDPSDITIYGNFDPSNISGGVAWYDATDQSSITKTGTNVTQWNDKFNSYNLVKTAGNDPQWITGGLNGNAIIRFDGTNSMHTAFPDFSDAVTTYWVGTINGSTSTGIFEIGSGSTYNTGYSFIDWGSTMYWRTAAGGNRDITQSFTINQSYMYTGWHNGANSIMYRNGLQSGSVSAGALSNTLTRLDVGGLGAGTFRGANDFGELLVYNTAHTTQQRNLVEQYQSAKWGISLTPPGTGATEVIKATASDGYSAFTTRYLERLSQSANISLQASNSITLDLQGDTLAMASDRNFSLTTTNGNISSVSSGTITTTRTGSGGNITMTAGGSGTINLSDVSLNATGGSVVNLVAGGSVSVTQPLALNLGTVSGTSVLLRTTGATSDITLNNTITASASGNAITLASGRNFINNAGSGVLSALSGRWLVYSTNPANDTTGSLANSFRRFSCSYGGSCPTLGSGNGFLYSYTPTLTVTPDARAIA